VGVLARDAAARAVADLVTIEVPPDLVESEIDERIRDLDARLRSQGLDLERYLEATGRESGEVREEFREAAEVATRVDLGLRAVAYVEYLDEDDGQLDSYLGAMAVQVGLDVDEVRARLADSGRMLDVRADVSKRAALEWLLDSADIVDEAGNPVDRGLLEPPEPVIPEEVVAVDETNGVDPDNNGGTGIDREDGEPAGDEEEDA
jgi:trigger factor